MGMSFEQPGTLLDRVAPILSHSHMHLIRCLPGPQNDDPGMYFGELWGNKMDRPAVNLLWAWVEELSTSARAGLNPRWKLANQVLPCISYSNIIETTHAQPTPSLHFYNLHHYTAFSSSPLFASHCSKNSLGT